MASEVILSASTHVRGRQDVLRSGTIMPKIHSISLDIPEDVDWLRIIVILRNKTESYDEQSLIKR